MINDATLSEDEENNLILLFKNCVISQPSQKTELKAAMKKTVALRDRLIVETKTNILEYFGFFYAAPDLVNWIEVFLHL